MEKQTFKAGEKVYVDTLSGVLKGIYLDRNERELRIKITSRNNKAYLYGEIVNFPATRVVPRVCFHRTGLFSYLIYPDYVFE